MQTNGLHFRHKNCGQCDKLFCNTFSFNVSGIDILSFNLMDLYSDCLHCHSFIMSSTVKKKNLLEVYKILFVQFAHFNIFYNIYVKYVHII